MQYFYTPKFDGTFTMSWVGSPAYDDEKSTQIHDIITLAIPPKKSITSITKFTDIVKGETNEHYFKKFFSFSNMRSGISYTDSAPITGITGEYCPLNDLYLNLTYYRIDSTDGVPTLTINAIVIEGTYDIEVTDEIIEVPDDGYILEPKNIYKIFKLTGYEIYGINTNNLIIKYRFTQDGGRTYTPWEPLSNENISTVKINPIRFAQVQYSITKIDSSITSKIYDVILTGDFQNINNYYLKTNRYGVREDCDAGGLITTGSTSSNGSSTNICITNNSKSGTYMGQNPNGSSYNYNRDWITQGLSCYLTGNVIASMTNDNVSSGDGTLTNNSTGTFNPYSASNQTKISSWYNYLANTVGNIFGWTIDYHLTDPDGKGIDRVLHEYQLFNIVDMQKLKIIVPENNFPDNQVQINEYMLDMMDTFKVLILKDEFQRVFGIEKRPSQKDIIYFCQANRAYRVRHAQVHREIMYMGIYYDVILEKYEQLANEQNLSNLSKNILEPLTRNNTLDSLFGEEVKNQQNKVVNKQLKPTTHDVYKANINKKIDIITKDIFNGLKGTKIANNYYNLSSLPNGSEAVTYTKQDPILLASDNRAITFWFSFNTKYDPNKAINDSIFKTYDVPNNNYSFISNYNPDEQLGYKVDYSNNQIILTINELRYALYVPDIKTNIWYGLSVNIDNRQRIISIDLFKRNYSYSITMYTDKYEKAIVNSDNSTGLTYYTSRGYRPVNNKEINETLFDTKLQLVKSFTGTTDTISFEINETITLYASDVKLTNIRIFNNIIPRESISDILQQRVIQDSQYLILADNASRQLYTDNILNTRWE